MAKKFLFTLQPVLAHREHLMQQAQVALAGCIADVVKLEDQRKLLLEELHNQENSRPNNGGGDMFMVSVTYIAGIKQALEANQVATQEANIRVEKARVMLVERNRDTRALEILRDKQKKEFMSVQRILDMKLLDDFGSKQFWRLQGGV